VKTHLFILPCLFLFGMPQKKKVKSSSDEDVALSDYFSLLLFRRDSISRTSQFSGATLHGIIIIILAALFSVFNQFVLVPIRPSSRLLGFVVPFDSTVSIILVVVINSIVSAFFFSFIIHILARYIFKGSSSYWSFFRPYAFLSLLQFVYIVNFSFLLLSTSASLMILSILLIIILLWSLTLLVLIISEVYSFSIGRSILVLLSVLLFILLLLIFLSSFLNPLNYLGGAL